jgi:hypothetical protein
MARRCLATLLAGCLLAAVAVAQSNGKLQGSVHDETKAVIPGVTVTLTNVETKGVQRIITVQTGEFGFEAPAGAYELKAELLGFETVIVPSVRVTESQTVRMDLVMRLARRNPAK